MTAANVRASVLPQWLIWAVLAVVCWGLWAITSKLIGEALTAGQSQALSTLGILPVIAITFRTGPSNPVMLVMQYTPRSKRQPPPAL